MKMACLSTKEEWQRHRIVDGVEDQSGSSFSPFYFSNLQFNGAVFCLRPGFIHILPIVDSEGENGWRGESSYVGTIHVRVIWTQHTSVQATFSSSASKLENSAVHERTKTLATHRVLLGGPGK
jgi:hypothetical protein